MQSRDTRTWKIIALALVIGLLGGVVVSAALVAPLFMKPGPQGEIGATGPQGSQGTQGTQGIQGNPGTNGTDAILQILQHRNDTSARVDLTYDLSQWFNMSDFDSSMKMTINIQQNSKIFVEFSSSHTLSSGASIKVRIVVDNVYNSSIYQASSPNPSSVTCSIPGHIEFLTGPLNSGQHTIEVQFQRNMDGPSTQLERTLTATEITTP